MAEGMYTSLIRVSDLDHLMLTNAEAVFGLVKS